MGEWVGQWPNAVWKPSYYGESASGEPSYPDQGNGIGGNVLAQELGMTFAGGDDIQGQELALPGVIAGGALVLVRSVITRIGWRALLKWVVYLIGFEMVMEGLQRIGADPGGMGVLPGSIVPGAAPGGLGDIHGRLVRTWQAGETWFAQFEQPSKRGTTLRYYAYSPRRSAWIPFRYRRNIVIGAKELSLAAALGHKRRLGKRRVLQTIAGHFSGRRQRNNRG